MGRCAWLTAAAVTLALSACKGADTPTTQQQPSSQEPPSSRRQQLREVARSVVLCHTTDSTLLRQLGRPSRDGVLHRGRVMSWMSPNDSLTRYVAVLLDSAGTVVDLYWDVPTQVPWVPTNQCQGR
jgi:hypothetical protein